MILKFHQQCAVTIRTCGGVSVAVDFGYEVPMEVASGYRAASATFVSHKHPDHFDRLRLEAIGAPVFAPPDVLLELRELDLKMHSIVPGDDIVIADLSVQVFVSDHGPNLSSPIDNLGLVFTAQGRRVLFLGDMAVPSPVPVGPWDAVLVPVGGSKVFTPEDAAEFVRGLGHVGVVIPNHYHGRADRTAGERFRAVASAFCDVRVLGVNDEMEL